VRRVGLTVGTLIIGVGDAIVDAGKHVQEVGWALRKLSSVELTSVPVIYWSNGELDQGVPVESDETELLP
jgi:hypothetical protein